MSIQDDGRLPQGALTEPDPSPLTAPPGKQVRVPGWQIRRLLQIVLIPDLT